MLWRLTRSQGSARPRVLRVPASVSPGHAAPLSRPRRPAAHCTPLCGCATVLSSLPRPEPCPAQPSLPSHARRRPSLSSSRTAPSVQVSRGNAVPALALFLSNQAHPRLGLGFSLKIFERLTFLPVSTPSLHDCLATSLKS